MPTSREVDNLPDETMAGVNSRFAVVSRGFLAAFLECVLLSPILYMLIQLFSLMPMNSDFLDLK